jgi:molybdenum cofactor cytidylyltransferase
VASLVGILLAAGSGTRFGGDKLVARVSGESIALAACRHLMTAVPEVIAVVRPADTPLLSMLEAAGARVVACADAQDGMGASLACGVQAAIDAAGWIVALADMPWIRVDTISRVAAAVGQGAYIAAPFYEGARGHPVGFGAQCAAALTALRGDEGARRLIADSSASLTRIDVDDPGVLRDVDTPADLANSDDRLRPSRDGPR